MGKSKLEGADQHKRCAFYNDKKKRNCRMQAMAGGDFCGLHRPDGHGGEERVPCPYGPQYVAIPSSTASISNTASFFK